MLQHKPKIKRKLVDVGYKSLRHLAVQPLDLSCYQLSFPFNNDTQEFVLHHFSRNPSKKRAWYP
jgi:hypothetical protein